MRKIPVFLIIILLTLASYNLSAVQKASKLLSVTTEESDSHFKLIINADGFIKDYKAFILSKPARLVIDFPSLKYKIPEKIALNNPFYPQLRCGTNKNRLRLVIDSKFSSIGPYKIETENDKLIAILPLKKTETPAGEVKAIDFEQLPNKKCRLVITTTQKVPYDVFYASSEKIILRLINTKIPTHLLKTLDTSQSPCGIKKALPLRDGDAVSMEMHVEKNLPFKIVQTTEHIYLTFESPSSSTSNTATHLVPKETKYRKTVLSIPIIIFPGTQQVFKGRPISIDFQDADIRQVLRIIAEVSELNIVVSEKVAGKVTLRLEKVPWDQALDIILQTYQLGMIKKGNVIRIVPIEQLKREQQMLIEAQETLQKREKVEPLITEEIQVNYGKGDNFIKQIEEMKSDRGKITYDEFTNRIIMTDTSDRIKKARALIRSLDAPPKQVMIEARIVEVNVGFARELGIQWGGGLERRSSVNWQSLYGGVGATGAESAIGATTSTLGGETGILGEEITNFPLIVSLPPTASYGGIGFTLGRLGKATKLGLDIKLQALEELGVGHILSTPKVITMDNQEAVISQGVEIPYRTVSELGTRTEFREAVLKLTVKPHITPDKKVSMELKVSKDTPGTIEPGMDAIPIEKKELETKLLVNDAETVVIGGVITEEKYRTVQRVPFFSRLPILGLLFQNKIVSTRKRELMIFITPTLVEQRV